MLKLIPNILTFGRLVLTIVLLGMILYSPGVENRTFFMDVAFVLFVITGLTDIVDGKIARRYNVTSKLGRIMDPLVDKVLVCGVFFCFAIVKEPKLFTLGETSLAVIHWSVFGIITAREIFVTALRHIAEARGVNFGAILSGKIKVFLQYFTIGTIMVKMAHVQIAAWGYWFTTLVLTIMLTVTIISGLTYHIRWRKLKRANSK